MGCWQKAVVCLGKSEEIGAVLWVKEGNNPNSFSTNIVDHGWACSVDKKSVRLLSMRNLKPEKWEYTDWICRPKLVALNGKRVDQLAA